MGRSRGLALGYVLGTAGAALVVFAAGTGTPIVVLGGFAALPLAGTVVATTAIVTLAFARRAA